MQVLSQVGFNKTKHLGEVQVSLEIKVLTLDRAKVLMEEVCKASQADKISEQGLLQEVTHLSQLLRLPRQWVG